MKNDVSGVSVIIPVYNAENYIEQCVQNLLNQTLKDLEIIFVIDKDVSDNSLKILENCTKSINNVRIICAENGYGAGYNRNLGITCSNKEYIGFYDVDDTIPPEYFEKLYEKAKDTCADIVMGETTIINSDTGEVVQKVEFSQSELGTIEEIFNQVKYSTCWDKIYKKEFLVKNNIKFAEKVIHEDNIFTIKALLSCKKLEIQPESVYFWMRNQNSVCLREDLSNKRLYDSYIVFDSILNYLKSADITLEEKALIIEQQICSYASSALTHDFFRKKLSDKIQNVITDNPNSV